jgi:Activator of Hsp90 ATPase homolog 1-like protein
MSDGPEEPPSVLRIERTFEAPTRAVFDAWTNVEVLRRWWHAERDWETPHAEVDLRVGGAIRAVMRNPDIAGTCPRTRPRARATRWVAPSTLLAHCRAAPAIASSTPPAPRSPTVCTRRRRSQPASPCAWRFSPWRC